MSAVSKKVMPGGERRLEHRGGALEVEPAAEVVAAEPDDGDLEVGVAETAGGERGGWVGVIESPFGTVGAWLTDILSP